MPTVSAPFLSRTHRFVAPTNAVSPTTVIRWSRMSQYVMTAGSKPVFHDSRYAARSMWTPPGYKALKDGCRIASCDGTSLVTKLWMKRLFKRRSTWRSDSFAFMSALTSHLRPEPECRQREVTAREPGLEVLLGHELFEQGFRLGHG